MIRKVRDSVPVRVLQAFGASQASNYASALAFNTLLAMFPLMLGILAIIGLSIRDPAAEASFQSLIVATFPATAQPELIRALHGVKDSAGLLAVISITGLIWSGSGIFATMEFGFAQIFGIPQRDTVRQKLMGFVMMIVLVVAVGVTVGVNALAGLLPAAWGSGKLLSLAQGEADLDALHEAAFAKPAGMAYGDLYAMPAPFTSRPRYHASAGTRGLAAKKFNASACTRGGKPG